MLATLQQEPGPATLATLTTATGLHANTVREHLDALVDAGLVRRRRSAPSGRGRPAWSYEARGATAGRAGAEYAGLAATLARFISRTSDSPRADAIAAGIQWGRDLVRGQDTAGAAADRRGPIVELLAEIGFAPRTDAERGTIRLTRCPLLETARAYPDVVCGVHLGIVRGALAAYGADPAEADLAPFAEPGACLLDLDPVPGSR